MLDLALDLLIGVLDSVDAASLAAAVVAGTEIDRHPTANATDLELALRARVRG